MLKLLVTVDGSQVSERVIEHAIRMHALVPLELHLLNVQPPIDSGHARLFVTQDDLDAWHRSEGLKALAGAKHTLELAKVPHTDHVLVGDAAESIATFAEREHFQQIMMATRGHGGLGHALLGSVSSDVVRRAAMPVTLVK